MRQLFIAVATLASAASLANAQLYGTDVNGTLYQISTTDATATTIGGGIFGGAPVGSLEYNPASDSFWTIENGGGTMLRKINRADGANSNIGPTGLSFSFEGALQLAPDGTLYGMNADNAFAASLFKVNPVSGACTIVGALPAFEHDINGLAWRSDNLLVGIDRVGNMLVTIDPSTMALSSIIQLPFTLGSVGGMANIDLESAYLVNNDKALYRVDLFTGATSLIGTVNTTESLRGLAMVVPAPGSVMCTLGFLAVASRRRR